MPRKKRSFIDKKKAVKFQVVHRSQHDPLAADGEASQYVLQPVIDVRKASAQQANVLKSVPTDVLQALDDEDDLLEMESGSEDEDSLLGDYDEEDADGDDESGLGGLVLSPEEQAAIKAEMAAGAATAETVHLRGEYDYSKHMRSIGGNGAGMFVAAPSGSGAAVLRARAAPAAGAGVPDAAAAEEDRVFGGIRLEKTVLATDEEERVGVLARGVQDVVRNQLPNDIRRALDAADEDRVEEEGFDELEDDFVALAMGLGDGEEEVDDEEKGGALDEDERLDHDEKEMDAEEALAEARRLMARPALRIEELLDAEDDEEREARKLRMLDEHFERLMSHYVDEEIGELDGEDPRVRGTETLDEHKAALDAYLERGRAQHYQPNKKEFEDANQDRLKELVVARNRVIEQIEGSKDIAEVDAEIDRHFEPKEKEQWDCESIVSTYSTTSNIPRVIKEPRLSDTPKIKVSRKTGIPLGMLPERGQKAIAEDEEYDEEEWEEPVNLGAARPKAETKAEKKARKKAQKEAKRLRRAEKKATKQLYASENAAEDRRQVASRAAAQGAVRM